MRQRICVRLEKHTDLRGGYGDPKTIAPHSPLRWTQAHGSHGTEELENGPPAQEEDSKGFERPIRLDEPTDDLKLSRDADELPVEVEGNSSSSVTLDKQPVAVVAGKEHPTYSPNITTTTEDISDTTFEEQEATKVEEIHRKTQGISMELKEKYGGSLKDLEKTREPLEASH